MKSLFDNKMDVLNKLYSTVSSTVSQLSTVLPGNPVTREYEATNHIASAGPGLLWKIFSGYKKSTNQEASIFLLEKRQLDKLSKNDREAVLETLRKSISQLARLRHPQILVVQHTLEESRDSLAFATEPVFASLANILGKIDNVPTPVPLTIDNFNLYEVEIKYGLLQLAEGLSFLHKDVKLLHRNICPQNVVINKEGVWKIFGFDHSLHCISGAEATVRWPTVEYAIDVHALAQPDLDFLAPESGISGTQLPSSDIFSFGMLIYCLYNKGQPLNQFHSNWSNYNQNISKLKRVSTNDLLAIPQNMREITKLMLNFTPELRPEVHDFLKSEFLEDVGIKALNYLDSLFQWDNLQKSQFFKGLPTILEKLPHRVCVFRIIPCMAKEFVNPTMVPFVLPSVFAIAESSSKEEFTQYILPHLKPILKMQEPVQIMLICMQKMEFLLKLTPADDVKSDVLPMLFRAIECDSQQLQELCLSVIPTFASLIDYPAMKNALMPRIKKLCLGTQHTSVRVNCLVCIGKLMEFLDKWLILDDVIPFLPQIQSRGEPAVLMSIVGIYKLVLSHKKITIPKEVMAGQILPFLIPLSIESSLTLNQFNAVIAVVKNMIATVETEQRTKLEQLSSIQGRQTAFELSHNLANGLDDNKPKQNEDLYDFFNVKPSTDSTKESKSLNLLEKANYSFSNQNEMQQRLQMEPSIAPVPVVNQKSVNKPKDLTSTLIENNLKEINLSLTPKSIPNIENNLKEINLSSTQKSIPNLSLQSPTNMNSFRNNIFQQPLFSPNNSFMSTNLSMNSMIRPPMMNNSSLNFMSNNTNSNFGTNSTGLSPAAFFNSSSNNSLNSSAQQKPCSKQLTSSEINDFLN